MMWCRRAELSQELALQRPHGPIVPVAPEPYPPAHAQLLLLLLLLLLGGSRELLLSCAQQVQGVQGGGRGGG